MIRMKIVFFCCFVALLAPISALALNVGDKLPTFVGQDLNGKTVDLNTIVGKKPIMLVFWSTWCDDCKEKLPEINEMVKKYSDNGLEFIGINIGMKDTEKKARAYVKEKKMTYPNVFDKTGKLSEKYQLNKVFALIVAAKDGTIMMRFNNIPEFGDETLEILKTYVHPEGKKSVADEGKPKK